MFIWRWLSSSTVRQATDLARHVQKLINEQRDILKPEAMAELNAAVAELRAAIRRPADGTLKQRMTAVEKLANQVLQAYPHASMRENVEVFLVAVAVALAVRTFILQPFKIPTGSMQPTLYGIISEDLRGNSSVKFPTGLDAFIERWYHGNRYLRVTAVEDGEVRSIGPRSFRSQQILVGNQTYTILFPPESLQQHTGLQVGQFFRKGEDIIRAKIVSGDHLFVDRLTYNFRPPKRGEIIVFATKGIPEIAQQDQFYIKRMVAMGGEKVRIGDDQHLVINGQRLDAATPHFENVYSFSGDWQPNHYFGHVNGQNRLNLAPRFRDENTELEVRPKHYLAMGDNTLNSSDSRVWGDLPQENIIGKSFFVYWPITDRFGWSHR